MVNRSKIVIAVDSFIALKTFRIQVVQHSVPKSRVDDRVNYQKSRSTAHHAAPSRFQMVTFGQIDAGVRGSCSDS
jgi:hypothetical protein